MYLQNYFNSNSSMKQIAKESSSYSSGYDYWLNTLFERAIRLFKWTGPEEDGVPEKELEIILMMNGSLGVTDKYKKTLAAFHGNYAGGPTVYYDRFTKYSVHSPVYSNVLTVGKDVAVISNNAVRNSIYPLCHRYATMLSHTEVSFVNALINGRDSGGVPVASTEAQRASIEQYRNALCNGRVGAILDPAFSGVQFIGVDKNTTLNIKDLIECRENLLNGFYHDLGIKTAWNKKGNMIQEEVESDSAMLLLNLDDMLAARQIGCEEVNRIYGTHWSVDKSAELQYTSNYEGGAEDEKI